MLDWLFPPSLPVDEETRTWIAWRTDKLVRAFGVNEIFGGEMILPDPEFHAEIQAHLARVSEEPEQMDAALTRLVGVIARRMNLSPDKVEAGFFSGDPRQLFHGPRPLLDPNEWSADTTGARTITNGKVRIALSKSVLSTSWENLVAVVAHQLAHALLILKANMTGHEPDIEFTAELLAAYYGFGLLLANGELTDLRARTWEIPQDGQQKQPSDLGHFTYPAFGYALAVWTARCNAPDAWSHRLRLDIRHAYKKTRRWLRRQERLGEHEKIDRRVKDTDPPVPRSFFPASDATAGCGGSCSCSHDAPPEHDSQADTTEGKGNCSGSSCETSHHEPNEFIPITPDDFFTRAMFLMGAGDPTNALADFEEAIALGGDDADFHIARAEALLALNRPEEALDEANQAVAREPNEQAAYLVRARVSVRLERFEEAAEDASWIIEGDLRLLDDLQLVSALYVRGLARLKQGDAKDAVDDLSAAWDMGQLAAATEAELLALRAEAYDQLGRADKAAQDRRMIEEEYNGPGDA